MLKELPRIWAYQTTMKISTGGNPFLVVYGSKALIFVEIGEQSLRFPHTIDESYDKALGYSLDLVEGRRKMALIRMASQKQRIERFYN